MKGNMKKNYLIFFFLISISSFTYSQSWQITTTDSVVIKYEKNIVLQRNHLVFSVYAKKDTQNIDLNKVKEIRKLGKFSKGFLWGLFLGGLAGGGGTYYLISNGSTADKLIEISGGTPPNNDDERDKLMNTKNRIYKYVLVGAAVVGVPLGFVFGLITMGDTKFDLSKLSIEHKKELTAKLLKQYN